MEGDVVKLGHLDIHILFHLGEQIQITPGYFVFQQLNEILVYKNRPS